MARFNYKALDGVGRRRAGQLDAADAGAAARAVAQEGMTATEISLANESSTQHNSPKAKSFLSHLTRQKRLKADQMARFLTKLGQLLQSSAPLENSLALLSSGSATNAERRTAERLLLEIREGRSFAEAVRQEIAEGSPFPPHAVGVVRAGEASGDLGAAVARLSDELDRLTALQRSVRAALAYPMIVLVVSAFAIGFLLVEVVPQFEHLLRATADSGALASKVVLAASHWAREWGASATIVFLCVFLAIRRSLKTALGRRVAAQALRWTPIIGRLARKREAARWCNTTSALLVGGATLTEALEIANEVVLSPGLQAALAKAGADVQNGTPLSDAVSMRTNWPSLVGEFARIGEEVRLTGNFLGKAGQILDDEAQAAVTSLTALLAPTVIILLGALVGVFVATIFSAILSVNAVVF